MGQLSNDFILSFPIEHFHHFSKKNYSKVHPVEYDFIHQIYINQSNNDKNNNNNNNNIKSSLEIFYDLHHIQKAYEKIYKTVERVLNVLPTKLSEDEMILTKLNLNMSQDNNQYDLLRNYHSAVQFRVQIIN